MVKRDVQYHRYALAIGVLIIFAIGLKGILEFNRIYIIGDEFGYWANASHLAGFDWTNIAKVNPYYSFGYSLWLIPLFLLKSPETMYKMAILLNAFFLSCTYLLIFECLHVLMNKVQKSVLAVVSLAFVLYSNNIFSAATTQSETLLLLLYTLVFWLVCQFVIKKRKIFFVLAALASIYMYYVHMRSIAVLASVFLCLVFIYAREHDWKKIIFIGLGIVVGILLYNFVKSYLIDVVYLNNETVAVNDYAGQVGKFAAILSIDGIKNLCVSLGGKIFYLGSSTFFLAYWCVLYLIEKFIEFIKKLYNKEKIPDEYILWGFIAVSVAGTFCISAIAALEPYRIDALFYGRYNEMLIVPILIVGFLALLTYKNKVWIHLGFIVVHIFLAIYLYEVLQQAGTSSGYGNNMSVMASLALNENHSYTYPYFTVTVALKSIIIGSLLVAILRFVQIRKVAISIIAIILFVVWSFLGIQWKEETVLSFQTNASDSELADTIQQLEKDKEINCYIAEETNEIVSLSFDFLQFMLKDFKMNIFMVEEITEIPDEYFVINQNSNIHGLLDDSCRIIQESTNFSLIQKTTKTTNSKFLGKDVTTWGEVGNGFRNEDNTISSNGEGGLIVRGQNVSVTRGEYAIHLGLDIEEMNGNELGYIEAYMEEDNVVAQERITKDLVDKDGNLDLTFSMQCGRTDGMEFHVYANEGNYFTITNLSYVKTSNDYDIGKEQQIEIKELVEYIDFLGDINTINFVLADDDKNNYSLEYLSTVYPTKKSKLSYMNDISKATNQSSDLLVLFNDNEQIYDLLKKYTVVAKTPHYTVLVDNTAAIYKQLLEKNIPIYSSAYGLSLEYFQLNTAGYINKTSNIWLSEGVYNILVYIKTENQENLESGGTLYVESSGRDVVRKEITEVNGDYIARLRLKHDWGAAKITYERNKDMKISYENVYINKIY